MLQITKDRTPVLYQQPGAVQQLATKFNQNYTGKNSVKTRAEWGRDLEEITRNLVNAKIGKGDKARILNGEDTFSRVCRELGIVRQSAYNWINEHIARSNYPQVIQDAAADAGLNLALPHVMSAYQKGTYPTNPDIYQAKGIVAELANVPPPDKDEDEAEEPITNEKFVKQLAKLIKRGLRSMTPTAVVSAVEAVMKDAQVPEAQQDALLHNALDMVDQDIGINTRDAQ